MLTYTADDLEKIFKDENINPDELQNMVVEKLRKRISNLPPPRAVRAVCFRAELPPLAVQARCLTAEFARMQIKLNIRCSE